MLEESQPRRLRHVGGVGIVEAVRPGDGPDHRAELADERVPGALVTAGGGVDQPRQAVAGQAVARRADVGVGVGDGHQFGSFCLTGRTVGQSGHEGLDEIGLIARRRVSAKRRRREGLGRERRCGDRPTRGGSRLCAR